MFGVTQDLTKAVVPVSRFNKGEANKIFQELKQDGVKAVFKNNQIQAMLISPQVYDQLMEMLADQLLIEEVRKRVREDNGQRYSFEEIMNEAGITKEALEAVDEKDIEFE